MKRLLSAAVAVPLALAAVFLLPSPWFFAVVAAIVTIAAVEFVRLGRAMAPRAPLAVLPWLVVGLAMATAPGLLSAAGSPLGPAALVGLAAVAPAGLGLLVLLNRGPVAEKAVGLGMLAFGLPYFAAPIASLYRLQRLDPWLLLLLLAIVWLGDAAAFYAGSRFGRHKLAPVVSPNKSWEGSVASLAAAVVAAAVWGALRSGGVAWDLLALAALTNGAAQAGDLVESILKRAAGAKDSGRLVPGHGGVLDRIDALLFAAPVWLVGLHLLGRAVAR